MDGKLYRLREFMRSDDNRALIVDASASLSLGVVPGLEDFEQAVRPVLSHIDGLVCSPGQIRRIVHECAAREKASRSRTSDLYVAIIDTVKVPVYTHQIVRMIRHEVAVFVDVADE